MRRLLLLTFNLGMLLVFAAQARAQAAVEVTDVRVTYDFGEQVIFTARFRPASSVQEGYLFFQAEGDQRVHTVRLNVAADGTAEYRHLVRNALLRPFARVFFWFRLTLTGGETYDSPRYFFKYDDDRYPWQTLEADGVILHWYAGDPAFGQEALTAARMGLLTLQELLGAGLDEPVDVYVYASAADVQNALGLGGYSWVGGHASPDLGVVLVSISPGEGQGLEMERQIPHELAHVLLYRMTGESYASLPSWLVEGIASQAEQSPNGDYAQVLAIASRDKSLLRIEDLCGLFPADASGAILAYAQSDSFTRYLRSAYGTSSLHALINAYADGLSCDQGAIRALGLPLSQLEARWRQSSLGEDVAGVALRNLLPYIAILLLVLALPAWRLALVLRKKGHS